MGAGDLAGDGGQRPMLFAIHPEAIVRQFAMTDQPEVGRLGFIIRRGASGFKWLIQAKTEPGKVNATQLGRSGEASRLACPCPKRFRRFSSPG